MILALRTDSAEAYIAIFNNGEVTIEEQWAAGRQLSVQLPSRLDDLLAKVGIQYDDLTGVVAYEGPGSFTGLRIGITIANAIAHTQGIPIIGSTGEDWLKQGIKKLPDAKVGSILSPTYGGEANITKPKK